MTRLEQSLLMFAFGAGLSIGAACLRSSITGDLTMGYFVAYGGLVVMFGGLLAALLP